MYTLQKIGVIGALCMMLCVGNKTDANGYLSDDIPANRVLYLMAHNAHSSSALGWRYYQQTLDYDGQWNAGARGGKVILQWRLPEPKMVPHKVVKQARKVKEKVGSAVSSAKSYVTGSPSSGSSSSASSFQASKPFIALCHEGDGKNNCALTVTAQLGVTKADVDPAMSYFTAMAQLLKNNPRDTVVIIIENYLTDTSEKNGAAGYSMDEISKQLNEMLVASGIAEYAYKLSPEHYGSNGKKAQDWPTLGQMRKTGKRALIFINNGTLSEKSPYLNKESGMFKRSQYAFDWKAEDAKKDPIKETVTADEINQMCSLLDSNQTAVALRVDIGPESSLSDKTTIGKAAAWGQKISYVKDKMEQGHAEVADYTYVNSKKAIEKRLNQCQVKANGTWPTIMMTDFIGTGDLQSIVVNINKEREKLFKPHRAQ